MQNSDSQSLFSMSKRIRIFLKKFYWWISFVKHVFGYWHFLTTFTQLTARPKNFLMDWLLVLGLEEGLVECATLCLKSWVILTILYIYYKFLVSWSVRKSLPGFENLFNKFLMQGFLKYGRNWNYKMAFWSSNWLRSTRFRSKALASKSFFQS